MCPFLSSFCEDEVCEDDEGAASGQQLLQKIRGGFAERGEDWLRMELVKHCVRELRSVAAAAAVPRNEGGAQRSKQQLVDALWQCIAEEQSSGDRCRGWCFVSQLAGECAFLSSFCEDDEGAASGQQLLQKCRGGFAERGEDWLRMELDKHRVRELRRCRRAAERRRGPAFQAAVGGRSVAAHCRRAVLGGSMPWILFRVAVRWGCALSSSFCEDGEGAASGQLLQKFRGGFAERGEELLRVELDKHGVRELRGVAAAAGLPRHEGGAHHSKEQLVNALYDGSVVTWGHARFGGTWEDWTEPVRNVTAIQSSFNAFAAILIDGS